MPNNIVLNGLNPANKVQGIYAYLIDELKNQVYSFLYNPEQKAFSRHAQYDEGVTALSSIPSQHYRYTKGKTLQLSNLILESYSNGKTCQLLLDKLQALMVANPINGVYAPTPVYFKWGVDSFGPAVITDLSWTESSWLNGKVATASVDITLLEIPDSQLPNTSKPQTSQNKLQATQTNLSALTDRQKSDAKAQADSWLKINIKKLPENVSNLVRANAYTLSTDDSGNTTLYDKNGNNLGLIGIYSNGKLNSTTNAFISLSTINIQATA